MKRTFVQCAEGGGRGNEGRGDGEHGTAQEDARAPERNEASRSACLAGGFLHEGEEGAADGEAGVELPAVGGKIEGDIFQ